MKQCIVGLLTESPEHVVGTTFSFHCVHFECITVHSVYIYTKAANYLNLMIKVKCVKMISITIK